MKQEFAYEKALSLFNDLISNSKVRSDVEFMLNSNIPLRSIFMERGEFPMDAPIEVVFKQINLWNYDVSSSGKFYLSLIVALGEVCEFENVMGEVGAKYGFVTLHYNSEGNIVFYYWHRNMWDNELE